MATLSELLDLLPVVQQAPPLVGEREAVRYVETANPLFVEPGLVEGSAIVPGTTSVLILSAPAAVGKTTLAKEIARRTKAPLWDLAKLQVGSHSFLGTLTASVGAAALADVLDRLGAGRFLVVLDALDEAHLRAGTGNFDAFLEEVAQLCKAPRARPVLVLLARAENAEDAATWFELQEVPFAHFQVDFFDQPRANEFIDRRLDSLFDQRERRRAHRVHRGPFCEARDVVFQRVFDLLGLASTDDPWLSDTARRFVGYAPVLDAVSEFLCDDDNYRELKNRVAESPPLPSHGSSSVWEFLIGIVDEILKREQGKVIAMLRERLGAAAERLNWSDWESLYSPDEQRLRVLTAAFNEPAPPLLPTSLPGDLREGYEQALLGQIREHPFRGDDNGFANAVFREDLYAWHLIHGDTHRRTATRERMERPTYLPTPVFARSLLTRAGGDEPEVDAEDLGALYESLRSQASVNGNLLLDLYEDRVEGAIYGEVSALDDDDSARVTFRLRVSPSGLSFPRRLSNATISVTCDVVLGREGRELVLGPDVTVECGRLRILGDPIRVETGRNGDRGNGVILFADSCEHLMAAPQVVGSGGLAVRWDVVRYPWVQYATPAPSFGADQHPGFAEAYAVFRRVLLAFRGCPGLPGELVRAKLVVDHHVVGKAASALASDLFQAMIEDRLIDERGRLYVLNRARVAELGISRDEVRLGTTVSGGVLGFLQRFLQARSQ